MTGFEAQSRWSFTIRCPRMGAYAIRGLEPEEPTEDMLGYFARGKDCEEHVAQRFIAQYGAADIIRHKAIPWPAGIAHGDIFVRSKSLPVEVKSMADPRAVEDHIGQLAGQIAFDEDADSQGLLVLVNPVNYRLHPFPVTLTEELTAKVHERAAQVARAADRKAPLPDRVCERPSDAIGKGCPFVGECFSDWEVPDPVLLEGDVATLAHDLFLVEREMREHKAALGELEERRNELRAELAHTVEPATQYRTADGAVDIKITEIAGRTTFGLKAARETGQFGAADEKRFEAFISTGKGHRRWNVKLAAEPERGDSGEGIDSLADWGDVPWTDEDLEAYR